MQRQTAYAIASAESQPKEDGEFEIVTPLKEEIDMGKEGGIVIQGRSSEDAYCVTTFTIKIKNEEHVVCFYGVFDGHCNKGGDLHAAEEVAKKLPKYIEELLSAKTELNDLTITQAITEAVGRLNAELVAENGKTTQEIQAKEKATTATCLLRIDNAVYVINIGDSRGIVVKPGEKKCIFYRLTEDAKPGTLRFDRGAERMNQEVQKASEGHPARLACVAMSRDLGLGDLSAQPKITGMMGSTKGEKDQPKKGKIFFENNKTLVVLASDGLWDVASDESVAEAIDKMAREKKTPNEMATALALSARKKWREKKEEKGRAFSR